MQRRIWSPWLTVVAGLMISKSSAVVSIDWVDVGDAGHPANVGGAAVGYDFRIAKYEVTIGQYAEFLSAVASSDPYGLWDPAMENNPAIAGIARSGSSGTFIYTTIGSPQRPINMVSWFDAARFCNWLHNGQGSGSTETGAYNLNGGMHGAYFAEPGATIRLPTMAEWRKAGYFDPTPGASDGDAYWTYPTRSDVAPGNTIGSAPNQANYTIDGNSSLPGPNRLTDVGAFTGSASYYGTFDQGGNVYEWTDFFYGSISGPMRGQTGGAYYNIYADLYGGGFGFPENQLGFRVAVPEPGSLGLVLLSLIGLWKRRLH